MAGVEDTMRAAVPSWYCGLDREILYRRTNYIHEMSCGEVGPHLYSRMCCADNCSVTMEHRLRTYSSDSDGVFIEDSCYQGMLRAMDHRKDERDRVQKKTFTKWVNKHLMKAQRHITDLYEDLRDGHNLISLLEVLSGETLPRERDVVRNVRLPREKGRMRFHKLQNVQIALDFLKHRQVKLVNIRNDDIADGNPKLTLGLIWTIILHFQISDIQVNGQSDDMTAKEKLLLWSQRMVEGYQGLRCDNFTTNWRDGKLFNAIIHKHR
ncbi:Plectin [Collichthys lucidus]|uniref:Plectin n=1 Tax=Collichthys lucidus TaxID=240159 RepID=A0A4U5VLN4_COLLU|nr:Plectin [Collichthys lucidus]